MSRRPLIFAAAAALVFAGGCKPKAKEITSLQRKEAATLVSEALFALQLHDLPRAEGLYVQATALCPDEGKYWVDLGSLRVRLGHRDAARTAYKSALTAYETLGADNKDPQPLLQQVYVLALMGRVDDAKAALAKVQKLFPDNRAVRGFTEGGQFEKMLADPRFREIAL